MWPTGWRAATRSFSSPKRIVVGRDIRLSSAGLTDAVCRGLTDSGVDVYDIGICGTEGVYFATFDGGYDGGIMITASHNPPDYNGMKFVREQSKPISGDNGLREIREFAERGEFPVPQRAGARRSVDTTDAYVAHLLSYVDAGKLKPLKIVVNAGNGGAGLIIDKLEPQSAVQVHQDSPRAGRPFPERHPESHARGESRAHGGGDPPARRGFRHRLGRRLRPLLFLR